MEKKTLLKELLKSIKEGGFDSWIKDYLQMNKDDFPEDLADYEALNIIKDFLEWQIL